MKRFNILKEPTYLYGVHFPVGACIGKYTTHYKRQGKPCSRTVIYAVCDFRTYRNHCTTETASTDAEFKLYHYNYRIRVYDTRKDKWYSAHTDTPSLWELANFLTKMFAKNNIGEDTRVEYYTTRKQLESCAPKERKVQNSYIFKPSNRFMNLSDPEYDPIQHIDVIPHWDIGNERVNYATYPHKHTYHKPMPNTQENIRRGKSSGMNTVNRDCKPFDGQSNSYMDWKFWKEHANSEK